MKIYIEKNIHYLITFTCSLFIMRMALPYMLYPFAFFGILSSVLMVYAYPKQILRPYNFVLIIWPFVILGVFYVLGLLITKKFTLNLIHEIPNAIAVYVLGFFIYILIQTRGWNMLKNAFLNQFWILGVIAAIYGLINYFFIINDTTTYALQKDEFRTGTASLNDSNAFSMAIIFSILINLSWFFQSNIKKYKITLWNALIFLMTIAVLLSGSRRGFVFLLGIYLIIFIIQIVGFWHKFNPEIVIFCKNTRITLFGFILSLVIAIAFLFLTSLRFKEQVLNSFGLDFHRFRNEVTAMVFRYSTMFDDKVTYENVDEDIWGEVKKPLIDPFNPEQNIFISDENIVFPLSSNSKIYPDPISAGHLFDKNSPCNVWFSKSVNAPIAFSKVNLPTIKIKPNQYYSAEIYCYLSKTSNLSKLKFEHNLSSFKGKRNATYDIKHKGAWQKLTISFFNLQDSLLKLSYEVDFDYALDFEQVNGFAIFSNPKLYEQKIQSERLVNYYDLNEFVFNKIGIPFKTIITEGKNLKILPDTLSGVIIDDINLSARGYNQKKEAFEYLDYYFLNFSPVSINQDYYSEMYCYVSPDFNGNIVRYGFEEKARFRKTIDYNLQYKGYWQKLHLNFSPMQNGVGSFVLTVQKLSRKDNKIVTGKILLSKPKLKLVNTIKGQTDFEPWVINNFTEKVNIVDGSVKKRAIIIDKTVPITSNGVNHKREKYALANVILNKINLNNGKHYKVEVNMNVSDDYNGTQPSIILNQKSISGLNQAYYNFNRKGEWQKLELSFEAIKDTSISIILRFFKTNASNFSDLTGRILVDKIVHNGEPNRPVRLSKMDESIVIKSDSLIITDTINSAINEFKNKPSRSFFDKILIKRGIAKADKLYNSDKYVDAAREFRKVTVIAPDNDYAIKRLNECVNEKNFKIQALKDWNALLEKYSNDTKEFKRDSVFTINNEGESTTKRNNEFSLDNIIESENGELLSSEDEQIETLHEKVNVLYGSRTERWLYAKDMFFNQFSWRQKVFGDGFDYEHRFGKRFYGNDQPHDYPHNIIISSFLYSGLIGGLYYLFFVFIFIKLLWKYRRTETLIVLMAFISFLFSMVSSNTHFSSPILSLLMIIIFLIDYYYYPPLSK